MLQDLSILNKLDSAMKHIYRDNSVIIQLDSVQVWFEALSLTW